jgi:GTPase
MANFVTEKKRIKTGKIGAPTKNGVKRDKWFGKQRVTEDELVLIEELFEVLKKRRNITSKSDMLMYLVNKEYSHQDEIRVISKA